MLSDSHCHLIDERFDKDREEVIKRAKEAGIKIIINVAYDLPSAEKGIELAREYDFIFTTVGIHPHVAVSNTNGNVFKELEKLAQNEKVVAVGECGLDYYYYKDKSLQEKQKVAFIRQKDIANKLALPLIIHCREAHQDMISLIRSHSVDKKGVFHCFSGEVDFAREVISQGYKVGIAGPITFPQAKKYTEVIKKISPSDILIETDAPYLTPHPKRGKRNEPSYLEFIADKISDVMKIPSGDLRKIIFTNTLNLFSISIDNILN